MRILKTNDREFFLRKTIILLLCVVLLPLSGCNQLLGMVQQKKFDTFIYDMFVDEVQSDTITLHFTLSEPEKYGIGDLEATFGEYGIQALTEELHDMRSYLDNLREFQYGLLSPKQRLIYDILENFLLQSIEMNSFLYYQEPLGPTTGVQGDLPIILAEYSFYDKEDYDDYLDLLPCVYSYFEDIMKYEQLKSEQGLFMSDEVAEQVIGQCKTFVQNPEENFLITGFDEKIDSFDSFTREEMEEYKNKNREGVLNYVIPAYEMLSDSLTRLLGTGKNEKGLYYYPEGREYYEALVRYVTCSDKSLEEMSDVLEKALDSTMMEVNGFYSDPVVADKILSFDAFPLTDPEMIMVDLKQKIQDDFPEIASSDFNIKYVPESLSEYLSPAFYLIPPIDRYLDSNIYINGNDYGTLSTIYTTIAHEGFPGHMYQYIYFNSQEPAPIRRLMNFTGYLEGWATYAEMYSYHFSGIDESLADLLEASGVMYLCLYARADIGVHYEGWDKNRVIEYFRDYAYSAKTAEAVYSSVLSEPGMPLPYIIGYLEIMELKGLAEQEQKAGFEPIDFHRFLLEVGPAQFDIIEEQEKLWLKEMGTN